MLNGKTPYLVAIVTISVAGTAGSISLVLANPKADNLATITILLGTTGSIIASIVAAMNASQAAVKVAEVAVQAEAQGAKLEQVAKDVDGKLTQVVELTARASLAEGKAVGQKETLKAVAKGKAADDKIIAELAAEPPPADVDPLTLGTGVNWEDISAQAELATDVALKAEASEAADMVPLSLPPTARRKKKPVEKEKA